MQTERPIGEVASYRRAGYGWLSWNNTCVWIHIQDTKNAQGLMPSALKPGWKIQFDVVETPRGLRARNAVIVDTAIPNEVSTCPQTL